MGKVMEDKEPDATWTVPEPPPVHKTPEQTPQPLQGVVEQLRRARLDIGAMIGRLDELEASVRRVDRQVIMMAGALALILWSTRKALVKIEDLDAS